MKYLLIWQISILNQVLFIDKPAENFRFLLFYGDLIEKNLVSWNLFTIFRLYNSNTQTCSSP